MVSRDIEQPGGEEARDGFLCDVLDSSLPKGSILPWGKVTELVANAPPAHVPWQVKLFGTGQRQLRFALGSASTLLVAMVVLLGVMPAQSNAVGTLITTEIPSAWDIDSSEFQEVRDTAFNRFVGLDVPQGMLYLKVSEFDGRDQLALVLVGVEAAQARQFYGGLAAAYPTLGAFSVEYTTIDSGRYRSRLHELAAELVDARHESDAVLGIHVVKALSEAGFSDIHYEITRDEDGRIVIEIDAAPPIEIGGQGSVAELQDNGITAEVIGEDAYRDLLDELGLPNDIR